METGCRGTFVISWSQTQTDGEIAAPPTTLAAGKTWRWSGDVVRIDGPGALLRLDGANGEAELRRRAAERVRKLLGAVRFETSNLEDIDARDLGPLRDDCFVVTDGREAFVVSLVEVDGLPPLAMFVDHVPEANCDLWIVEAKVAPRGKFLTEAPEAGQMICFTPGVQIGVAEGTRDVASLAPGDMVQTKDNGLQRVLWVGSRRISGARLHVMPSLLPVRVLAGALGGKRPDAELLVSPEHRMLVQGARARDLFNAEEVLVSARDLVDGRGVWIDRMVQEVTYVHVLFERHEIVFANGLETESFHPVQAAMSVAQRAEVEERLPGAYDRDFARRVLSRPEAAILSHAA
ncbi:MAG: Hint domain-containing protein [Pseudomonadota bacterium]